MKEPVSFAYKRFLAEPLVATAQKQFVPAAQEPFVAATQEPYVPGAQKTFVSAAQEPFIHAAQKQFAPAAQEPFLAAAHEPVDFHRMTTDQEKPKPESDATKSIIHGRFER